MIVTDDGNLADQLRSIRNQGRGADAGWLSHQRLGYNFRLSDINCALGIVQLERIDAILQSRKRVAQSYRGRLVDESRIIMQQLSPEVEMSWFVFVIRLTDDYSREDRDRMLEALRAQHIACSDYFAPIHLQPFYREQFGYGEGAFPVCEALASRTIALPFFGQMTDAQIDRVCTALIDLL